MYVCVCVCCGVVMFELAIFIMIIRFIRVCVCASMCLHAYVCVHNLCVHTWMCVHIAKFVWELLL